MARKLKCQICKELSERELMEVVSKTSKKTGKTVNKYYHKGECWDSYLKEQSDINKEMKEKDELDAVLKKMFNIKVDYPDNIWWMIQDLRNGTNRFKKFWKKSFKKGYPYPVIAEAYRMSKDNIEWARLNKRFRNLEEEMKYSLKIIQKKLEDAYKKQDRTMLQEKLSEAKEVNDIDLMTDNREVKYKKHDGFDMSDILGD